jgi:hypothetical protein
MVALYRSGRQVEALRAYRAGYRALAEIGVQPGRELRQLETAISGEDPALHLAAASVSPVPPVGGTGSSAKDDTEVPVVLIEDPHATRTVETLVEEAAAAGRMVLHGRARVGARPYQCVADALAPVLDTEIDTEIDAGLIGALAPIIAPIAPAQGSDPAFQRFQAFEAVQRVLTAHAARHPLAVVLEDVDEAGASTLDLVEHLARHRGDAAMSLILVRTAVGTDTTVETRLRRLEREGLMHRVSSSSRVHAIMPTSEEPPGFAVAADLAADAFEQAVRLSTRAGDDALLRLGFEEASGHYRAALAALEYTATPSTLRRGELHLALGRACHAAYQLDGALTGFRRAAACAIEVGDVHLLGDAAVGVATATEFGMADAETEALLTAALNALSDEAPARVELLAGLARTLPGHTTSAIDRAQQAVALARRLGNARPLTIALATAVLVTWGPGRVRSRLADIDEVVARATELDMLELAMEARAWRAATLDQLGLERQARDERAVVQQWAEQSRRPFFLALASMMTIGQHLRRGELHAAEAALNDLPSGADSGPNFSAAFAGQLFLLRRQQRRLQEFIPLFDLLAADNTAPAAWHAARIVALAETGDAVAGHALEAAVTELGGVPHDWLWLATVTLLADACIHLGDDGVAAELHRRLWPYRDHTVVIAHGIASLGPVTPRLAALSRLDPAAAAPTWAHPTEAA